MSDQQLVKEVIAQILTAIERIERRAAGITNASDFVASDAGLDMLDAISMMLIAVGESCKNLDKITSGELLVRYPDGLEGRQGDARHH